MSKQIAIYMNPDDQDIQEIIRRPQKQQTELENTVSQIVTAVRDRGDSALIEYTRTFDKAQLQNLPVTRDEVEKAAQLLKPELRMAIKHAAKNIRNFHAAQLSVDEDMQVENGVRCWRRTRPIERVGLYVPGGTAPLFSTVLMLAIPASIAGCREIVLTTPPRADGSVHPAILFAASLSGVTSIIKAGGAQAIAALAYGTESVKKVDKIFGPGNQYVTKAKEIAAASGTVIDMPAGPSEVLIVVDETADPDITAADMLSQAEHGPDSQVIVIIDSVSLIDPILKAVNQQLFDLPRREFAESSLANSSMLCVPEKDKIVEIINRYAPEHLIIQTRDANSLEGQITNAGSVFFGQWTPESAGDYASGTNHTLPTNGWARVYSGVSVDSFIKKITFQEITPEGLKKLGPVIEVLAEAESLIAHKQAVSVRLQKLRESRKEKNEQNN
ncbi:MAG: histidinol dehydrogenase [Spirochaetales bacterium]|nr:histidinol dehydrogenase [Spirochaetales bacterium]